MNHIFNLDTSEFSKELVLMLEMLKQQNMDELLKNEDMLKVINWKVFIQLTRHHRVYPTIYQKIKSVSKDLIPTFVIEAFQLDYQNNIFRMLQLSGETESISKLLSEHELPALFLKGPTLSADLYGDISLRTSSDIDVLIPINLLEKVDQLLCNAGYEKDEYIQSVLNDWKWRHHHFTYFHSEKKIKLEVHWRLHPGPGKEPSFTELWERRRKSSLTKFPVYCLGKEDLFWFLVSHGARHGWSRLRWLVDIDKMLNGKLDWAATKKLFEKYHTSHVGGQSLMLSSCLLNSILTNEMNAITDQHRSRKLAQDALFYIRQFINLHNEPLPDDVATFHKKHLFSLMSLQQKCLFIISTFHPYFEDAMTLPLPKKFHFLYFPLRPILWLWRKTRLQAM